MARYEHIKGLPVVTVAEGKQVGKVDDLLVDPDQKAVRWFRLHTGGLLGGDRLWVPASAVQGLGEDMVTIKSEADVLTRDEATEAEALVKAKRGVIGSKVATDNGDHLGQVRDFEFAPDTFAVTQLFLASGLYFSGQLKAIPGDTILSIGEDMIVVPGGAVTRPGEMADTGGKTTT